MVHMDFLVLNINKIIWPTNSGDLFINFRNRVPYFFLHFFVNKPVINTVEFAEKYSRLKGLAVSEKLGHQLALSVWFAIFVHGSAFD